MEKPIFRNRQVIKFFAFLTLLCLQHVGHSQVFTRILAEGEKIYDYIPWYFLEEPLGESLPPIDINTVLEQDALDSTITSRFGIKAPMGLTKENGAFYPFGNYSVWKLKIYSKGAKSLNFEFSELNLPPGSQMFIHGMEGRMLHGPIEADKVHEGIYASDIVLGDYTVIDVYLPEGTEEFFSITVTSAIHGIDESLNEILNPEATPKTFGASLPCNINTACPEGNGWETEINAVCLILRNDPSDYCTGTLIVNACNDLTPFILTANHCTDGQDLSTFVFRFNYESFTCPPTVEPHSSVWISFSGAQLRASWVGTDFALLEMNNPVAGTSGIAFAGWDRSDNIPMSSTFIHHPAGDVKKITVDAQVPAIEDEPPLWAEDLGVNMAFRISLNNEVNGDFGMLEGGSSGSAQFNQEHRIVGQHAGGDPADCNTPFNKWEGRFFNSWTGGGTNATRLSDWLGNGVDPMTTNALLMPSVVGSEVVCTTPKIYPLQNPLPGFGVTWSVTPAHLFGSTTTGNGVNATLWAANSNSQGPATLTYTLTNATCETQTFTRDLWVGKPIIQAIQTPDCFASGSNYFVKVVAQGATSFNWTFPNCPNGTPSGDPDPACWFNYTGNGPSSIFVYAGQQSGYISVWANNECGTSSMAKAIDFCGGGPPPCNCPIIRRSASEGMVAMKTDKVALRTQDVPEKIRAYPNPTKGLLNLELDSSTFPVGETKVLSLLSLNGRLVYTTNLTGNSEKLDIGDLVPGVYFLKIHSSSEVVLQKIIVQ